MASISTRVGTYTFDNSTLRIIRRCDNKANTGSDNNLCATNIGEEGLVSRVTWPWKLKITYLLKSTHPHPHPRPVLAACAYSCGPCVLSAIKSHLTRAELTSIVYAHTCALLSLFIVHPPQPTISHESKMASDLIIGRSKVCWNWVIWKQT